jgi:hypothetical protein
MEFLATTDRGCFILNQSSVVFDIPRLYPTHTFVCGGGPPLYGTYGLSWFCQTQLFAYIIRNHYIKSRQGLFPRLFSILALSVLRMQTPVRIR